MDELFKFPLDIDTLNDAEVQYELRIRGITPSGTLRVKCMELKKVMETEPQQPMTIVADDHEFNLATDTLAELQKQLKAALVEQSEAKERVLKSKIRHYQDRAFRASASAETDTILYGIIRNIRRTIRMSVDDRPGSSRSMESQPFGRQENTIVAGRGRGRKSMEAFQPSPKNISLTNDQNSSANNIPHASVNTSASYSELAKEVDRLNRMKQNASQPSGRAVERKLGSSVPLYIGHHKFAIHKWPIRFSGVGGLSLTDFLLKIDLYAKAEGVPMQEVFKGIFKLLDGVAMEWFEVKAAEFHSWEQLVSAMKNRFLSQNHEYRVREEILERYQNQRESVSDYLLHMDKLFQTFCSKDRSLTVAEWFACSNEGVGNTRQGHPYWNGNSGAI